MRFDWEPHSAAGAGALQRPPPPSSISSSSLPQTHPPNQTCQSVRARARVCKRVNEWTLIVSHPQQKQLLPAPLTADYCSRLLLPFVKSQFKCCCCCCCCLTLSDNEHSWVWNLHTSFSGCLGCYQNVCTFTAHVSSSWPLASLESIPTTVQYAFQQPQYLLTHSYLLSINKWHLTLSVWTEYTLRGILKERTKSSTLKPIHFGTCSTHHSPATAGIWTRRPLFTCQVHCCVLARGWKFLICFECYRVSGASGPCCL